MLFIFQDGMSGTKREVVKAATKEDANEEYPTTKGMNLVVCLADYELACLFYSKNVCIKQ
jgi:hypothetical protein